MVMFLALAGLFSFFYLLIIITRKNRNNGYLRLLPGPPGLPILGNLLNLGDLPHQNLALLSKKYGSIMSIRLGKVPAIVISSPEMAELFLKTHDANFASRPKIQASEYMSYGSKGFAFSAYGSYWRNMRKLCTSHLLSNSKIESFRSMRSEEVRIVVESIRVAAESGEEVDVSEKVGSLVEDVTYRMVFGVKDDDKLNLKQTIQELVRIAGVFNLADYVHPCIGALDLQGLTGRMKAVSKVLDEFFERIIDDHVQDERKQQEHHKDFVDVLLSLMDNATQQDEQRLDRSNIKAIMLDILGGAMDTSATATVWALSELLKNPRVMKRVQQELKTVVGLDRMVEESDLVKLDYLEMVVKESMRLHPVAPLLVPHESIEDITINGYDIPKKSRLIVNIWAMGRDPQVWSHNAQEFYPERFEEEGNVDIDLRGHDFRLIPFGSGRRGCPGMQLGLTMVRLILAQLVHCFEWKLPNGMLPHDLDMSEKFGLSVPRAKHLIVVPTYRLKV